MSLKKRLFSDTIIYGFARYLSILASIFLTPIYTRILTSEDYGVMDIFNTTASFLLMLLPMGLYSAILRFYPDVKDSEEDKRRVFGTLFTLLGVSTIGIFGLSSLGLKGFYLEHMIGKPGLTEAYFLNVFIVIATVFFTANQQIFQIRFEKKKFLLISLVQFFLLSGLGFVLVYFLNFGILGFFRAGAFALLVSVSLAFYLNRKQVTFSFDKQTAKNLLSYSIHFISVNSLLYFTQLLDRYLIKEYLNLEDVGIFSISTRIAGLVQLLINSFAMAWMPYILSIKDEEKRRHVIINVFSLYLIAMGFIMGSILFLREEVLLILAPPEYLAGYAAAGVLLIYNFVMSLAYFITIGLHISKATKYISYAAVASLIVNVAVSIALVKPLGIAGPAVGSLIGGLIWIAVQHYFSQQQYRIKFNYSKILLALLVCGGVFFLSPIIDDSLNLQLWQALTLKAGILLIPAGFIGLYVKRNFKLPE